MSLQPRRIKRQLRDNRFSINLTNDETDLLTAISNLTGVEIGVLLRQMVVKQAIETLTDDDAEDDFNLNQFISEGAQGQLSGS